MGRYEIRYCKACKKMLRHAREYCSICNAEKHNIINTQKGLSELKTKDINKIILDRRRKRGKGENMTQLEVLEYLNKSNIPKNSCDIRIEGNMSLSGRMINTLKMRGYIQSMASNSKRGYLITEEGKKRIEELKREIIVI